MNSMESNSKGLQRLKWYIFIVAWFSMLSSLVWPALVEPFPFLPSENHTATGFVVALSFLAVFGLSAHRLASAPLLVALIAFLVSPATVTRRPRSRRPLALWWGASLALLLIWVAPLTWQAAAHRPLNASWSRLMWGFYVYASAHTLMFVACLMAPPALRWRRRDRGKVGFPVVYPPNS